MRNCRGPLSRLSRPTSPHCPAASVPTQAWPSYCTVRGRAAVWGPDCPLVFFGGGLWRKDVESNSVHTAPGEEKEAGRAGDGPEENGGGKPRRSGAEGDPNHRQSRGPLVFRGLHAELPAVTRLAWGHAHGAPGRPRGARDQYSVQRPQPIQSVQRRAAAETSADEGHLMTWKRPGKPRQAGGKQAGWHGLCAHDGVRSGGAGGGAFLKGVCHFHEKTRAEATSVA